MLMKAPVLREVRQPITVEQVEVQDPQAGEVMVRMVASGVCHSCLHAADGSWADTLTPMILGDEGAGIIEKVGAGVSHLKPGDHVIVSWAPTCGRCYYCVAGRPPLCDGRGPRGMQVDGTSRFKWNGETVYHYGMVSTYAPYAVMPESCAIKIRDDMPLELAALIGCSVMTGVGSVINTAQVAPGMSLAVFGCGGVGLNAVQGGRLASAQPLIAVDVADNKLEFARQMGATHTVNPAQTNAPDEIRKITGRGVDYAVVTVGDTRAIETAWASLAKGGTCVVVGLPASGTTFSIDVRATLVGAERRLMGSNYGSARTRNDFPRMVELYLAGKLKIDELITRKFTINETNEAFQALAAGELARGLIVF
ncbi:MAG: Zn-dependent alcohol dehydrogenase [Chloroflexota bacterium]